MTDDTLDLDNHRSTAAQNATRIRRQRLHACQADQTAARHYQQAFEKLSQVAPGLVAPAKTWPEAAAKASYLIRLFAATPEAQDPCHQWFIANALDDLTRLCDHAKGKP
jgi:hypothetical protein